MNTDENARRRAGRGRLARRRAAARPKYHCGLGRARIEGQTAKEAVTTSANGEISVSSIHSPSLTPYVPSKDKADGTAILVIPGGGHRMLAITHEGYNVAAGLRRPRHRGLRTQAPPRPRSGVHL